MERIFSSILIALAVIAVVACGSPENGSGDATGERETTPANDNLPVVNYPVGEVIPSVKLKNFPDESYSVYLPIDFKQQVAYPVIIFFDPQAEGNKPLELYRQLADTYNFILVGSNTSQNGQLIDRGSQVAMRLIDDVQRHLPVDDKKIALCGFSGGAKVALMAGDISEDVSSVIYCAAATKITYNHPLQLLGFAGVHDMNYLDVILFDSTLPDNFGGHYVVEWEGGHEFPSASAFRDAFELLASGTIKDYSSKQPRVTDEQIKTEQRYKQQYIQGLRDIDMQWWRDEIAMLNRKKNEDVMYERLLGYVSLACYTRANSAIRLNRADEAAGILQVYQLADPKNPEVANLKAQVARMKR